MIANMFPITWRELKIDNLNTRLYFIGVKLREIRLLTLASVFILFIAIRAC